MKWITRERAMVDRIACPWLITRYIDQNPEFVFVPSGEVKKAARELGAIPFDVEGAELNHFYENGKEYVTFDAFIRKYRLEDPALAALAEIVRSADAHDREIIPEAEGLKAIATGFRLMSRNDYENMSKQFPVYDALYEYCKSKVRAHS
jgi:Uncharacterized conserved protein, COG4275